MNNIKQFGEIKQNLKNKIFENIKRADSGLNRLIISLSFLFLSFIFVFFGYKLVIIGAKGEFAIFSEYKRLKLTL